MAGSSSSSIQKSFKYDVFLSFSGTDTRKTFTGHLYQALQDKGISTYKDEERITKGKNINDELLGSIEDSRIYIVVFSKKYASSSWCLKELVKIMECHKTTKHTAYPVFYDVEPTNVRYQTGEVGEAFSIHENNKAAAEWRKVLKEAADLAGWELKNTANGSEAKLIQIIVKDISQEIYTISFSFDKKLVGIETRVNDIVSSLEIGIEDVRMMGIKGMGGAGKTTLVRAVYDNISNRFEGTSFVENVREVTNNPLIGLKSLQRQILSDVLNEDIKVSGVGDGKHIMKRRLCGRKVLIALDDVDDIEQLEALAGEPDWFKSGSRIIITTRDLQVLLAPHRVILIHDINLLSTKEAICLFSRHAFGREDPVQGYEELSEQVVRYAAGLPLTIKVLGSQLYCNDKPEWEDALQRLKEIPLAKTLEILELSYNALENDQKEIFLDVACMMKGWRKDKAVKALERCGFRAKIGLKVLQQKSLIIIDDEERVGMHDHIEEMGSDIVRRLHRDMPHKHSRLWKNDEIEYILANDLGTEETRCLKANARKFNPYIIIKGLKKMKALRFINLVMGGCFKSFELNRFNPSFPEALGYLHLECYPFSSLPKEFQANNLVTLEMPNSEVEQLWEGGEHKVLGKLRFLDLSHSKLKTLDLRSTPNLETLNLGKCYYLVGLPDGMWELKSIRSLELNGCKFLEKLPEDLFRLGCLEKLNLSSTNIKHLPGSICVLKNLKYLKLDYCKFLEKLPEDLGHLDSLQNLCLSSTNIKHLPYSICMLKHLRYLKLNVCPLLDKLPEDLGHLQCLEDLDLSSTMIKHLPDSICKLKHLKFLGLRNCLLLEKLPKDLGELEVLRYLSLSCTKIKHLPDSICLLKHLKYLNLDGCLLLDKLPKDLGNLECLESLYLSSTKIKHLPHSICKLKHLHFLCLRKCSFLEKLPEDFGKLGMLRYLGLSDTKIKRLPDSICMLKHLKSLHLSGCTSLEKLPGDLRQLGCLDNLSLSSTKIKHLPDNICMLKHLKYLKLNDCKLLEKLPEDLGHLECLEDLNLSSTMIKHLPDSVCKLKHLKDLNLGQCLLLEKLPEDLGRLERLQKLYVEGTSISHLPQSILLLKGLQIYGSRGFLQSFAFASQQIQTFRVQEGDIDELCYVKL